MGKVAEAFLGKPLNAEFECCVVGTHGVLVTSPRS